MPRNGQVRLSAPRLYSMNRILPLNATPHLSSKRAHGLSRSLKSLTVNPELQCTMLGQPHLMEIDSRLSLTLAVGWRTRFMHSPPTRAKSVSKSRMALGQNERTDTLRQGKTSVSKC